MCCQEALARFKFLSVDSLLTSGDRLAKVAAMLAYGKQETEIKRKLEMETGNGNRKLKTEMETKDAPITGAIFSS